MNESSILSICTKGYQLGQQYHVCACMCVHVHTSTQEWEEEDRMTDVEVNQKEHGLWEVKKHRPAYFHIMREVSSGNKDWSRNLKYNVCHLCNSWSMM